MGDFKISLMNQSFSPFDSASTLLIFSTYSRKNARKRAANSPRTAAMRRIRFVFGSIGLLGVAAVPTIFNWRAVATTNSFTAPR